MQKSISLTVSPSLLLLWLLAIYVVYAAVHFMTASNNGCNARMTLLTMFPVRQLYTIPMIDRAFTEYYMQPDTNPASPVAGAIGLGMKKIATDMLLSPDACLLVQSLFGTQDIDSANSWTGSSSRSTAPSTLVSRSFFAKTYGELTRQHVTLYKGPSDKTRSLGTCTEPDVLVVRSEHDNRRYGVSCDGVTGYVDKDYVRFIDGPPKARLLVQSAFLYSRNTDSSKAIAICHRPDIRSVRDRVGDFYSVKCDGKFGWVEVKHIEIR